MKSKTDMEEFDFDGGQFIQIASCFWWVLSPSWLLGGLAYIRTTNYHYHLIRVSFYKILIVTREGKECHSSNLNQTKQLLF